MIITKDVFKKYLIENGKMSAKDVRTYVNVLTTIAQDTNACCKPFYDREASKYKKLISNIIVSPVYRLKNKKLHGAWDIALDSFIEMLAGMGEVVAEPCACECKKEKTKEEKACCKKESKPAEKKCCKKEEKKEESCCCAKGGVSKEDFVKYLEENTKLVATTVKNYSESLSNVTIALGMDEKDFYGRKAGEYENLIAAIHENDNYVNKTGEFNKSWNSALKYFAKMVSAK